MDSLKDVQLAELFHAGIKKQVFSVVNCIIMFTFYVYLLLLTQVFITHWVYLLLLVIGSIFTFLYLRSKYVLIKVVYWVMLMQSAMYVIQIASKKEEEKNHKEIVESRSMFIYQFNRLYAEYKNLGQVSENSLENLRRTIDLYEKDKPDDNGSTVPRDSEASGANISV